MSTIVSCFVSNINQRYSDSIERYYKNGSFLLQSTTPKIIFVDKIMFDLIDNNYNKTNTLIIEINKNDIYLYDYLSYLNNFEINTSNNSKDTIEFIFTMCNKTEWVKKAICLNHFKTDNFIWVDFGIKHIFNKSYSDDEFILKINNLQYKKYNDNKVRIGNIWNLDHEFHIDIYKDIVWYFAGGVFGGNINSLEKFGNLMKSKCIDIIISKNTIMWDVNIWFLIYKENKELFNSYYCDHDKSLIDNY